MNSAARALLLAGMLVSLSVSAADLKYSGSNVVEPIVQAAAEAFKRGNPQFKIAMSGQGTTPGFKDLCSDKTLLIGASRPIKAQEVKECATKNIHPVELPIAMGAVAIIVPLSNTSVMSLTLEEIRRIYEPAAAGKIMNWKDVRPAFPSQPLVTYGVGIKYATFEFFHNAIGNQSFTRMDLKDSDNHQATVKSVAGDPGGIGYVPLGVARDFESQVRIVAVDFGKGPVTPSAENILDGLYPNLSRQLYLYVNPILLERLSATERLFVKGLVSDPDRYVRFVNLIPLRNLQYHENIRKVSFSK